MPMKVKKTERMLIDEGEYKAVVSDIQEKEGKWGPYYIWNFLIKDATQDDEPVDGHAKISGITTGVFSENSKLYKWAKACGLDVTDDEIDLEDAVKCIVRAYIEDENDKEGRTWSKVSKLKALKRKKAVEDDDDDEDEAPKKKKTTKKKKKTDDDDEEEVPKKKKKKAVEDSEDDDEDEAPKKKKTTKKKTKKKKKKEPVEDEDDEDSSEDASADEDAGDDEDDELFNFSDDDDDDDDDDD